jgi:hypothetical protein
VFLPGIIGATIGRWRVDRNPPPRPEAGPDAERADTDVFSAVRADEAPTGEVPVPQGAAQSDARTAAVATAEREAPTETIPTIEREGTTEAIPTAGDDAKTEVIRTDTDPKHAKPGSESEKE